MKIVCVDNFGRDYIDDWLVLENVNKFYGERIVNFLNDTLSHEESQNYYVLKQDDYELNKFEI